MLEEDCATAQFRQWIQRFASCKPALLYISGHHVEEEKRPIFFNASFCAVLLEQGRLRVGQYHPIGQFSVSMNIFIGRQRQVIEATMSGFTDRVIAVIVDACNLRSSAASNLQKVLSGKRGNPLVFGFVSGTSPPKGTVPLYSNFVKCLSLKLGAGRATHEDLIKCWLAAGRQWSMKKYNKNIGVLDSRGQLMDYRGKPLQGRHPIECC